MYRISFAGAGRVASSLCMEFFRNGYIIEKIVSLTPDRGKELADASHSEWSDNLSFPVSSDIIIVAVPDSSLCDVVNNIRCGRDTVVVHTAGSYGQDVFPENIIHRGVFYPLQTFSQGRKIDFKDLPFFIESSDEFTREILTALVSVTRGKLYEAVTGKRKLLHLSAVFACNFTNHMLSIGKELSLEAGFDFNVLEPLIRETISKSLSDGPENSQTGPAVRNDENTLSRHLDLLSSSPELQQVYKAISESIRIKHSK